MPHILYILAFTIIAFLAISNLIRNLISVSVESQRGYRANNSASTQGTRGTAAKSVPHPELLDSNGKPINEPLLVMRSVTVEDAREQLDAIYDASPSQPKPNKPETDEDN